MQIHHGLFYEAWISCEVVYEMFHILNCVIYEIYHFTSIIHGLIRTHKSPVPNVSGFIGAS